MDDSRDLNVEPAPTTADSAPSAREAPKAGLDSRPHLRGDAYLRSMLRQLLSPDGTARLVEWMARRMDAHVVLCDEVGRPLQSFPALPEELLTEIAADIRRVAAGEVWSAAADLDQWSVCILALHQREPQGLLVVARQQPLSAADRDLAADGARLLWLRSRAKEAAERQRRLDAADASAREATLHLLMTGNVSGARRAAAALGPGLPSVLRLHIVECPANVRDEGVRRCEEASQGRAFIVRCPVYSGHVILLAPADSRRITSTSSTAHDPIEAALRALASTTPAFRVGTSQPAALRDTADAYGQAIHAVAVARNSRERFARFSGQGSLSPLLGPPGRAWARRTLRPLLEHVPHRKQDPDAAELLITLTSWLTFYGGASRHLKIHRNTLLARMRLIEQLLDGDLDDLATQATTHLAVQMLDHPPGEAPAQEDNLTLDFLLGSGEVADWARIRLGPLLRQEHTAWLDTLRAWLECNAKVEAAAARLGISSTGVRKRLARIEGLIKGSLLNGPSVRYDMWFAMRALGHTHSSTLAS